MNALKNRNANGKLLTYQQTAEQSNIGVNTVMRLARESGALGLLLSGILIVNFFELCFLAAVFQSEEKKYGGKKD